MLQLNYGDKIRFTCSFQHKGPAYTGAKLHAAIGTIRGIWPHDFIELLQNEVTVTGIVAESDWMPYTKTIDITITTALAPASYEAYVKLMSIPGDDIFWDGPENDIVVAGGSGDALFQNLSVSYAKV